jgi:two-component system chemotaxis response regulator CheB
VTTLHVCDVEDKEPIRGGHVYVAPPDYHLLVEDDHFSLSVDAAVRYSRPSIDVAFASAADSLGPAAVGVLLTGANDDGARGLRHVVRAAGGRWCRTRRPPRCARCPRPGSARWPTPRATGGRSPRSSARGARWRCWRRARPRALPRTEAR